MPRQVMLVTGQASGDLCGAMLASEIRRLDPEVKLVGVGGEGMRSAGVEIVLDSTEISVVGIWEALVRLPRLRRALGQIRAEIARRRPDLVVLVDYPGMNLRLARSASDAGIKVMYFVSPQVWAWGGSRVNHIRRYVDKMVVILPFEAEIYESRGVDVTYVGHPLIDVVKTRLGRDQTLSRLGLEPNAEVVALLPGSRRHEVAQHLGPLLGAARLLARGHPERAFVVATLPALEADVRRRVGKAGVPVAVTSDLRYEAIAASGLAITCSGTVTLETALLGTPMIVIYKLAFFSWVVGKLVVRVPYISLTNLVAGERVVPELLQGKVTPANLARAAESILGDRARRVQIEAGLAGIRSRLGAGGATRKAAEIALSLVSK
jgi:lipid-A-disaccharide synthase